MKEILDFFKCDFLKTDVQMKKKSSLQSVS